MFSKLFRPTFSTISYFHEKSAIFHDFVQLSIQKNKFEALKYSDTLIPFFDQSGFITHKYVNKDVNNSVRSHFTINSQEAKELPFLIGDWLLLKYKDGGLFKQHIDYQSTPHHIGTLLLYPPKSFFQYRKGNLILHCLNGIQSIEAQQKQWTLVFLPLGVRHQVEQTQGTRVSLARKVEAPFTQKFDRCQKKFQIRRNFSQYFQQNRLSCLNQRKMI